MSFRNPDLNEHKEYKLPPEEKPPQSAPLIRDFQNISESIETSIQSVKSNSIFITLSDLISKPDSLFVRNNPDQRSVIKIVLEEIKKYQEINFFDKKKTLQLSEQYQSFENKDYKKLKNQPTDMLAALEQMLEEAKKTSIEHNDEMNKFKNMFIEIIQLKIKKEQFDIYFSLIKPAKPNQQFSSFVSDLQTTIADSEKNLNELYEITKNKPINIQPPMTPIHSSPSILERITHRLKQNKKQIIGGVLVGAAIGIGSVFTLGAVGIAVGALAISASVGGAALTGFAVTATGFYNKHKKAIWGGITVAALVVGGIFTLGAIPAVAASAATIFGLIGGLFGLSATTTAGIGVGVATSIGVSGLIGFGGGEIIDCCISKPTPQQLPAPQGKENTSEPARTPVHGGSTSRNISPTIMPISGRKGAPKESPIVGSATGVQSPSPETEPLYTVPLTPSRRRS